MYLHSEQVDISIRGWMTEDSIVDLQLTFTDFLFQLGNVLPLPSKAARSKHKIRQNKAKHRQKNFYRKSKVLERGIKRYLLQDLKCQFYYSLYNQACQLNT